VHGAANDGSVQFGRVEREPPLSHKVADRMLKTIVSRQLRPGDRLPSERELGEQFGVSRTVIREAVRALVAKGLIEVRSGSGLRVAAVDASAVSESMSLYIQGSNDLDYRKVHEVRTMLEVQMAELAALRRNEDDVTRLTTACERMESAIANVEAAARADVEFHREIACATHNELYLVLLDAIGDALVEVRRRNLRSPLASEEALLHHRRILDAILAGESSAARDAMREHLDRVAAMWEASTQETSSSR
jgi:GntR family transcriptional regulator, transcriptional repressor for pyruvate dehydrogenase complex